MKRAEMIKKLMWNQGGAGFGICSFGNAMIWAMDEPGPNKPDLISTVAISGDPKKYTDEELAKLLDFSQKQTARYDAMFNVRRGCNLIVFDKREDGMWLRKRLTWEFGPMYSRTLDEAIAIFTKDWK
jgi:hypothetical protein